MMRLFSFLMLACSMTVFSAMPSYAVEPPPPTLPCVVNGNYDGYRCGVDLDNSGFIDSCDELKICYRPDGGQCSGDAQAGYTCSNTGLIYTTAEQCQTLCGGSKDYMCPADTADPVCSGTAPYTKRSYMELDPADPETKSYTFALTSQPYTRTDLYALSTQYGGHAASKDWKDFMLQTFGAGPLFIGGGTLYSDGFFGSPDSYACGYNEPYNGSIWRPRDYCPGNNCTNYNVSPSGAVQKWERIEKKCSPTAFCQDIYYGGCLTDTIKQDIYIKESSSNRYITSKIYYTGWDSGSFYYNNASEFMDGGTWYGVELRCTASTNIAGYNVCTTFSHKIYKPSFSKVGTFTSNGECNQYLTHWDGPAGSVGSFYVYDTFTGNYIPPQFQGTICHNPGQNAGSYNNTQTVSDVTLTTQCVSPISVPTCGGDSVSMCNMYSQSVCGSSYTFSFGNSCSNTTVSPFLCGGQTNMNFNITSSITVDQTVEFRDIPGLNTGVTQWDFVKCKPCQNSSSGIVNDDPVPPGAPVLDESKVCTNFKMMGGAAKRCRPSSITTLLTNCCDLKGWFKSWCKNEERELKKRRQAGICTELGTYCSKKIRFLGICLEKKKSYCCFNSKLSRIINEQGRPQIGKSFGTPKKPDCKGFTPEEFSRLDFSSIDLSEYIADITTDTARSQNEILEGVQEWMTDQQNPTKGDKDH